MNLPVGLLIDVRIGVHTCAGGDRDSTHSADVDDATLLPSLFEFMAGCFYVALAGEKDCVRVLKIIRNHLKPDQMVFVGVINPIDPRLQHLRVVRGESPRVISGENDAIIAAMHKNATAKERLVLGA